MEFINIGIISGLILYIIITTIELLKTKKEKKKLIKKMAQQEAELVQFTNYIEKIRGIDKNKNKNSNNDVE